MGSFLSHKQQCHDTLDSAQRLSTDPREPEPSKVLLAAIHKATTCYTFFSCCFSGEDVHAVFSNQKKTNYLHRVVR